MKLSKTFQKFVAQAKERDSFWVERAKLDFSMSLEKQRRDSGMTYSDISRKISTSAAYITKVFRGDANMTIESMVKLARATGGQLQIQIVDEQASTRLWNKLPNESSSHSTKSSATVIYLNNNPKKGDWFMHQKAA